MTTYNPGIPSGTVNLDQDYINIKNNFAQLDTSFGVDHVKYSVATKNGYHQTIHQIPRSSDPSNITAIGQIYSKTVGGDTQLFYITGGGGISQLTGYSQAQNGFQYLGGVLIQWGFNSVNNQGTTTTITFPQAFSANAYSVTLGVFGTISPSPNAQNIFIQSVSSTNFVVASSSSGGTLTKTYWMAIGKP